MRWLPRGPLRWLIPGMRVKRWVALAILSMGIFVVALFGALDINPIVAFDRIVPMSLAARHATMFALLLLGILGFGLAVFKLVRSVARGVAPTAQEKTTDIIYRTRILERGPRVVAIGGGTGLSTLLRGLKQVTANLTAIVTVMDDGGSSGRLRDEIDVLPPGDVRNCILALAEDETRLSDYFQHRFRGPDDLDGHSLGNLILVGLEQATGSFDRAIEAMSHFLSVRGRVLPATLEKTHLIAEMEDGDFVEGESRITEDPRKIRTIRLSTPNVTPYQEVLQAIADADLIVLGPGSLFTSLVPNLLVEGVSEAIVRSPAEKALIANLMTQPGETDGFTLCDHLRTLDAYVPVSCFDLLVVNNANPADPMLAGYRSETSVPVLDDGDAAAPYGLTVVRTDLLGIAHWAGKETIKHDPGKLARTIAKHSGVFTLRKPSDTATP